MQILEFYRFGAGGGELPWWLSSKESGNAGVANLEDPLEREMTTHSSILAWRIPWTEEPVRLQSMGLQRVGHGCLGHGVWAVNSTRETLKALVLSVTLRGPGVEG